MHHPAQHHVAVVLGDDDRDEPEAEHFGHAAGDRLEREIEIGRAEDVARDRQDTFEAPLAGAPARPGGAEGFAGHGRAGILTGLAVRPAATGFSLAAPTRAQCHTSGTLPPQNGCMDDIYLCPDCRSEHAEPYEPVLGHLARCVPCGLLLEALADEAALQPAILEIRLAA